MYLKHLKTIKMLKTQATHSRFKLPRKKIHIGFSLVNSAERLIDAANMNLSAWNLDPEI